MIAAVSRSHGTGGRVAFPHLDRAAAEDLEELERRAVDVFTREPADPVRGGALVAAYQVDLGAAETPPQRRFLPDGTS